jgi:hypothetical protein
VRIAFTLNRAPGQAPLHLVEEVLGLPGAVVEGARQHHQHPLLVVGHRSIQGDRADGELHGAVPQVRLPEDVGDDRGAAGDPDLAIEGPVGVEELLDGLLGGLALGEVVDDLQEQGDLLVVDGVIGGKDEPDDVDEGGKLLARRVLIGDRVGEAGAGEVLGAEVDHLAACRPQEATQQAGFGRHSPAPVAQPGPEA